MFKQKWKFFTPSWLVSSCLCRRRASHNKWYLCCAIETDRTGAQSIELKIDEDRAWKVLSRTCSREESVERIVSSINGLVTGYLLVPAVLLVRDRTTSNMLFHLDAFLIQVAADGFVCALDLFLCASSACRMSTLSPCTSLSSSRFLGSRSLAVCSRVLGSRSLSCFFLGFLGPIPGLFSFLFIIFQLIDLSSNSSSSSCPFLVSFSLVLFPLVVFVTFSLSVLNLLSCRIAHRVPMDRSTSHLARGTTVIFLSSRPPSQLLLSALFNMPLPVAFSSDHHISLQSRQ